ncbi:dihydrofolate reductase [Xylanimonas protaetiae]|uniref:Dihydrofolate reductase n=1 Tax=Xylanimonas protaetiae TaxID=2509457 RepID=A0A4P6F0X6_9MICO|nr:dihydrofolate reductase [Xylanimonas protaetiae]QAY69122.1 dihydrofolate reductase [Xylanimonas protaetiae]
MIALIWAQARDAAGRPVIGAAGDIPWRVPEDFARFKALTSGHPVVMGRATWDSLHRRPLPGRTNVVVTRQHGWSADGAAVAHGLHEAMALATAAPGGDCVWVIGGEQVYAETVALADRLEVTEIDLEVEGDAVAPAIDPVVWHESEHGRGGWAGSARDGSPRYRFRTYVRR